MSMNRRRFLALSTLTVAGAVTAAAGWKGRLAIARWLFMPPLPPAPPGPLRDSAVATLEATVRTLLEDRVPPDRYVEDFRWHAEHVPGARALYERFESVVDRGARRAGHDGFRAAPDAVRRRILAPLRPAHGMRRFERAFFGRDEERFARDIVRRTFTRFSRTDAYVFAGYSSWPGTPRSIAGRVTPESAS